MRTKDRLQNYLIFCFQNTQSFKGFWKQIRSSCFVTIPKVTNFLLGLLVSGLLIYPGYDIAQAEGIDFSAAISLSSEVVGINREDRTLLFKTLKGRTTVFLFTDGSDTNKGEWIDPPPSSLLLCNMTVTQPFDQEPTEGRN